MQEGSQQDKLRIIDDVVRPSDLRALRDDELAIVCDEIRQQILDTTSKNGGHVASSLGAVELIVALHAELDCPRDKIVFDVGHQAYAHKILTGRLSKFDTLRQRNGISGFTNSNESDFDTHPSGHASDSLSVALGLAKARDLLGGEENIVAVIGDASISGGMAFEALNQIGQEQAKVVIVLNDNGMSIARNVGALSHHFGNLRASNAYRDRRNVLQRRLAQAGPLARAALDLTVSAKGSIKHLLLPESTMVFEQLGITCFAPVDGHDIPALRKAFRRALDSHGPTLVHVVTRKGAGYGPASTIPELFHGVGPFDVKTGEVIRKEGQNPTFTQVFGEAVVEEAMSDGKIIAITAGMKDGTGLKDFAKEFPDRFVDVGIAEEHAVGLASGLAAGGAKPVVAVYSTFLQRSIDQMVVDVALAKRDVVFCVDRAGIVGEDGPTHHGVLDLAYCRLIPDVLVFAPSCASELKKALHAALELGGPFFIRYPKGPCPDISCQLEEEPIVKGRSRTVREGDDIAILALGSMVAPALAAAKSLLDHGISARVVDMRWAKPIDRDAVMAASSTRLVVTAEEGVLSGGFGEGVQRILSEEGKTVSTLSLGIPDEFIPHGRRQDLLSELGLDDRGIVAAILRRLGL